MKKDTKALLLSVFALLLVAVPARANVPGDETPPWVQQAAAIKVPTYQEKDVPAVVLVNERTTTVESDGRTREVYQLRDSHPATRGT